MAFLKDVVGPCFIVEDVIARRGAKHHENIYYVPADPHFQEDVKRYCTKTKTMIPCLVDMVRTVVVGKKLPYGRLILDKPYKTSLVVSHAREDGSGFESTYSVVDFDVDVNTQRTIDERYLERLSNQRQFREDFDRFVRKAEELFDESPQLPMADFA